MLAGCSTDEAIIYGLATSRLVIRTPEVARFYVDIFAHHPENFVTYKVLRMQGDLLTKGQLQLLGLRTNTKISRQFYETLNDDGLLDPFESAATIAINISNAICSQRDIHRLFDAMGPDQMLRAIPSNMAAGPCAAARQLSSLSLKANEAVLFPLQGCDKGAQCGCRWTLDNIFIDDDDQGSLPSRLSLE
jgi:hypothetical protein